MGQQRDDPVSGISYISVRSPTELIAIGGYLVPVEAWVATDGTEGLRITQVKWVDGTVTDLLCRRTQPPNPTHGLAEAVDEGIHPEMLEK